MSTHNDGTTFTQVVGNIVGATVDAAKVAGSVVSGSYLEKKNKGSFYPASLMFPKDLRNGQEAIRFEIFKDYIFNRNQTNEVNPECTIYLPIPNILQPSYSAQYSETEIGFLGRAGASLASGDGKDVVGQENLTGGALNILAGNSTAIGGAVGAGAGKALGSILPSGLGDIATTLGIGGGVAASQGLKGAQFGAGVARNPHMAQLFQNVAFRKHSFEFKLAPKNELEQVTLRQIIRKFKVAMHPKYMSGAGNHMFDYPNQFDIDLIMGRGAATGKQDHHFYNFGACVLTDMSVNYLPNGPHVHDINGDKAPIAVNLSLNFTEINIITQDDINENNF